MDRDCPGIAQAAVAPYVFHELVGGGDPPGVRGQVGQDVEFDAGEREGASGDMGVSAAQIEHEFPHGHTVSRARRSRRIQRAALALVGCHAQSPIPKVAVAGGGGIRRAADTLHITGGRGIALVASASKQPCTRESCGEDPDSTDATAHERGEALGRLWRVLMPPV